MRTNTKIVSNKIQEHIKEFYTIEELKEQVTYMKAPILTKQSDYGIIEEMVQGGCFLIYNEDAKDFLNGLGINPEGKEYAPEKSWDLYKHLIAREGEKLCKKED